MKKLSEEEKTKLYEEVHPIALEYRESFIHKDEVIKDTFKTIEQLGFLLIRFPAIGENTLRYIKPLIIVFILTAGKILADNICHAGMNVTIFILAREME